MDGSEIILNLVEKGEIKEEIEENVSSARDVKSSRCNVGEKSWQECKNKRLEEGTLMGFLRTEEDFESDKEKLSRKSFDAETRQICKNRVADDGGKVFVVQELGRSQVHAEGLPAFLRIDGRIVDSSGVGRKIPRPANAFMLFANEWRKKLASENPRESNKDISVRLGILWKSMAKESKEKYFALAREVDAEHKRKYPDYVYNPKEARLRKAMREQSRELSRRSILQSAIARAGAIAAPLGNAAFLDRQHRFGCAAVSTIPMGSHGDPDRNAEPWFQTTQRPRASDSPRISEWYAGNAADVIERQKPPHQHRGRLEKCKDAIRNRVGANEATNVVPADCAAVFSTGVYPVDFTDVDRERELRRGELGTGYSEFTDAQKWHPYRGNGGVYQHIRTCHPLRDQPSGILQTNVQVAASHALDPWGQFYHSVLPHVPANIKGRGSRLRHTVLLRDRPVGRQYEFSAEPTRLTYNSSKLDPKSARTLYSHSQPQQEMQRRLESAVEPGVDSATALRISREDEAARWESASGTSVDSPTAAATSESSNVSRERDREPRPRSSLERLEGKQRTVSRQPLPGFHQAFGSTEIGRFSRSEFFANMVGESGGSGPAADADLLSKTYLPAPVVYPLSSRSCGILGTSAAIHRFAVNEETLQRIASNECCWLAAHSKCREARILENIDSCPAVLDCSRQRVRGKDWFRRKNTTISHTPEMLRHKENCKSFFANEPDEERYVVMDSGDSRNHQGDGFDNETPEQTTVETGKTVSPLNVYSTE